MTIKKRLFISNIMMIVIPIIIAWATLLIAMFILNGMSHGTLYETIKERRYEQDEKFDKPKTTLGGQWMLIGILSMITIIVLIYLTNHLLIKYVFSKVEQPLEMLSKGVHQIKDGNLDYRISHETEDEFKPICEDFNEMAIRLKASVNEVQKNEQNRKELITSISHDLRSPLTSVKAFVEGLIDGVASTPEARMEYLQIIKTKTDDINNMVSQLFLYSKMDMGNYPINPESLNIGKELSDFVAALQDEYKTRGLRVELGVIPREVYINADPVQLRSVFTNILDNSAKYKNKDTVEAVIRCELHAGIIRILFEDNGPGVPPDVIPKLFDVFYRSDPSRSNPRQGSGLGLAIASKALERMNGRIYAENRAEGGLCIIIEIPMLKEGNSI